MRDLIVSHLLDNTARTRVLHRELLKVIVEVLLYLPFGFRHEPKVARYTRTTGQRPERKRARVPEGVQKAGPAIQFSEPVTAPHQMIDLFCRSLVQNVVNCCIAAKHGLTPIKRLRTHFTDVIDAHQPCSMPLLSRA